MKKLIVIFVLVISCNQVATGTELSIGFKGGLTLANTDSKLFKAHIKTGYSYGVFFGIGIGQKIRIQPEVLYVRKGAQIALNSYTNLEMTYEYLEFPVLLKLIPTISGPIRINFMIGGAPAVKISATWVESVSCDRARPFAECGTITYDEIDEQIKKFDFALVFGAGLDILVPSGSITIEGRYNHGVTTIWKSAGDEKNRVWMISAAYAFRLGK